jgi:hypothetical protein
VGVPSIGEPEHAFVERHRVEHEVARRAESTERSVLTPVRLESECAELRLNVLVGRLCAHGDDHVDVVGRAWADRGGIRDEQLRHLSADRRAPRKTSLIDFLLKGVPYAFPAELGPETRGVPTAHAAPPLDADFSSSDALVWPFVDGKRRGASVEPLFEGAPMLAQSNQALYELLALVDALRVGQARERELATKLLRERLLDSINSSSSADR